MKDYEYSEAIQLHIENGNSLHAYRLLLQSHLFNVRLDIQTYCQLADGLVTSRSDAESLELLYRLYRSHFPPSVLMLKHFRILRKNADRSFERVLDADVEYLNGRVQPEIRHLLEDFASEREAQKITERLRTISEEALSEQEQAKSSEDVQESDTRGLQFTVDPELVATLREAVNKAENVVLHDVFVNLNNSTRLRNSNQDDWLKVYQREAVKQEAVQHSEQVRLTEGELIKGVSIGRIEINRKTQT